MSEYVVEVNENPTIEIDGWNVECNDLFVQREPIVRCRDCEFEMNGYCSQPDEWHDDLWFPVEPNGFCAWGERRNDQ